MHRLITTTDELKSLCDKLAEAEYVTVDTEFLREKTYYPLLCLIQVASPEGEEAAIDPLADGIDLAPLFELMSNDKVLKVFHAAKQDIEIFYYLTGAVPYPLYDTQVAAMVCGYGEQIGYEALVNKLVNESLDKASRYTDWGQRPLTQRQVDYAIADVTHLRGVYEGLRNQIVEQGREEWIAEEMDKVQSTETYDVNIYEVWRKLKYKNRTPAYLNILRAVAAWREKTAQQKDVPRGRVMKDESILQVAAMNPKGTDELSQVRGALKNLSSESSKSMLEKLAEAREVDPSEYPVDEKKRRYLDPQQEVLIDILKLLLKLECDEAGVASKLVANKDDLAAYVLKEDGVPFASGWRYDLFGKRAEGFLSGKMQLQAAPDGNGIQFTEIA